MTDANTRIANTFDPRGHSDFTNDGAAGSAALNYGEPHLKSEKPLFGINLIVRGGGGSLDADVGVTVIKNRVPPAVTHYVAGQVSAATDAVSDALSPAAAAADSATAPSRPTGAKVLAAALTK